jgi:hypothetical protein
MKRPIIRLTKMINQIHEARRRGDPRASPANIAKGLRLAVRRKAKSK